MSVIFSMESKSETSMFIVTRVSYSDPNKELSVTIFLDEDKARAWIFDILTEFASSRVEKEEALAELEVQKTEGFDDELPEDPLFIQLGGYRAIHFATAYWGELVGVDHWSSYDYKF